MKKINLSGYFPILSKETPMVSLSNGNVVMCYQVEVPKIYSLSKKVFDDLHSNWFKDFKSLPVHTVIHKQNIYKKRSLKQNNWITKVF